MVRTPDPVLKYAVRKYSEYPGWDRYDHGRKPFYVGKVDTWWEVRDTGDRTLFSGARKRDCLLWVDNEARRRQGEVAKSSAEPVTGQPAKKQPPKIAAAAAANGRASSVTPRTRAAAGMPKEVNAIRHSDKRANIPTADAQDFVSEEIEAIRRVRFARDETLDPQLVWHGKYPHADDLDGYDGDLEVDAPPIYIQEKIVPQVLIENLRRTAGKKQGESELTLFDDFDGLDDLDDVDFYQHDANWSNRMILGDSLQVMASLAEREKLRGKVQMVYIDPPYGIKFQSNWQVSARNRSIRDGNLKDAAREAEQVKAFRDTWEIGIHSYLSYLRDRLMASRELLTESGSCFVQIGDENVHLVRSLMDEVFGSANLVAQISFEKTSSSSMDYLDGVSDYLLWYAKSYSDLKYRPLFSPKSDRSMRFLELADGTRRQATREERSGEVESPPGSRWYEVGDITSQTDSSQARYTVEFDGQAFPVGKRNWATPLGGMQRAIWGRRVERRASSIGFVRFADDFPVVPLRNNWADTGTGSFTDEKVYVVQSGVKTVQRCLLMCTDPGDLVLDPTCGAGTSAFVAEQWGRRWITIDTSRVALALARQRVMAAKYPWYLLADSAEGNAKEQSFVAGVLPRQTFANDVRDGFVYDRVLHITLKSIANNPDITAGMTRAQIDAAIKRHADSELLYDKPFEDAKKVRVAGPFTVESLSPHRALSFGEVPESRSETEAAKDAEAPNFEQSILENLAKAGIQNGRKAEKLKFESFETYAGQYVQAIGQQDSADDDSAPSRIAISIGPQYGTVSASWVKNAAREAMKAEGVELLAILGFAFDPQVSSMSSGADDEVETSADGFANVQGVRKLGKLPVLIVRMNSDLLMGEDLKKTSTANLFTVFGEPDIEVRGEGDQYVVDLKGVDIYDPTTGEIRSNDTGQIALWMIDTDYDEESFFVRHCYFTGGNDPYKRLKTALKSDVDEAAWETLYKTVSRPFPAPETGKIAVKVINDYGDEVMKVIEVGP